MSRQVEPNFEKKQVVCGFCQTEVKEAVKIALEPIESGAGWRGWCCRKCFKKLHGL